jgi:hypothetical protein
MSDLSPAALALARKATLAAREGRSGEAEAAYRAWFDLAPDDPRPAYGLALLLLERGEYEEGFRLYESRAYLPGTGVMKPEYRPVPLTLPDEARQSDWARQTLQL